MPKDPRFIPRNVETERKEQPIKGNEILNNSIQTVHIQNDAITNDKIAANAVTPSKLITDWPIFYAYATGGVTNTVTGIFGDAGKPIFSNIRVNNGNHYNTTNGRFTAPTTGIYEFNLAMIHRYGTAAGSLEPTFYINGTNINNRGCAYSYVTGTNDHDWVLTHVILSLTQGQYVQCGIHSCATGTNYYYGENLGYFSGKQLR